MPSAPDQPATTLRRRVARALRVDAELPHVVRRAMRWSWVGWSLPLAMPWVWYVAIRLGLWPKQHILWLVPLVWCGVGFGLVCTIAAKRYIRRAAAHDHLLCPECLYDLRTLDEAGVCPECGRAYEHAAVRRQWVDAQRRIERTSRGGVDHQPPA
ncbi:MAG: hypothetical protein ACIAS6_00895 [Phycisphaerales bacterium JB060]